MGIIYLDNAATTPLSPAAARAVRRGEALVANPSSSCREGRRAHAAIEGARVRVARALGGSSGTVTFTSGATEANNSVLRAFGCGGARVVLTSGEHPSVSSTVDDLARRGLVRPVRVPLDADGVVDTGAVAREVAGGGVKLVCLLHASNEVGSMVPSARVRAIAGACRRAGAWLHLDCAQSAGKVPISLSRLGVDSATISAHKFGGPRGVGCLWHRRGASLPHPLVTGGKQEEGARAGTENTGGILGFAAALDQATEALRGPRGGSGERWRALREALASGLASAFPGSVVHGAGAARRLPNILSFALRGPDGFVDSRALQTSLDRRGIVVNTGSACSRGKRSRVLAAMGVPREQEAATVRVSFGRQSTRGHVDRFLRALRDEYGVRM